MRAMTRVHWALTLAGSGAVALAAMAVVSAWAPLERFDRMVVGALCCAPVWIAVGIASGLARSVGKVARWQGAGAILGIGVAILGSVLRGTP